MTNATIVLAARDVARLLPIRECIEAIARAMRAHEDGKSRGPASSGLTLQDGSVHAKMAAIEQEGRVLVAVKANVNLPGNPNRHGRPTIQGALILLDGGDGQPLAEGWADRVERGMGWLPAPGDHDVHPVPGLAHLLVNETGEPGQVLTTGQFVTAAGPLISTRAPAFDRHRCPCACPSVCIDVHSPSPQRSSSPSATRRSTCGRPLVMRAKRSGLNIAWTCATSSRVRRTSRR